MKLKISVTTILIFFFLENLLGQNIYQRGFIIKNTDTIFCNIKLTSKNMMQDSIFVKNILKNNAEKKYTPNEIKEYFIEGKGQFLSKHIKYRKSPNTNSTDYNLYENIPYKIIEKDAFLKLLCHGKAKLYLFQDESNTSHFFIEKDTIFKELYEKKTIRTTEFPGHIAGVKTGKGVYVQKNYIGILYLLLQDNPEIKPKIAETKLSESSLSKLLIDYNSNFLSKEELNIYKKDIVIKPFNISIITGVNFSKYHYKTDVNLTQIKDPFKISYTGGILFDYTIKILKKNIDLESGVLYTKYPKSCEILFEVHFAKCSEIRKLSIPVKLKYPINLRDFKIIYINAGIVYNNLVFTYNFENQIRYKSIFNFSEKKPSVNMLFGLSYRKIYQSNRSFILELNYERGREPFIFKDIKQNLNCFSILTGLQF